MVCHNIYSTIGCFDVKIIGFDYDGIDWYTDHCSFKMAQTISLFSTSLK